MSYSITYNPELRNQYPTIRRKIKKQNTRPVFYALIAVITGYILVKLGAVNYLLPGDIRVTTAAFSAMIEQVTGGEPIGEAVVTFVQNVVANGT